MLTARQAIVAGLVADGLSNKMIARQLGISPATVKNHVHAAIANLGVRNRAQLAAAIGMQRAKAA